MFVQAVETRRASSHFVENLCSGQGTAGPHSGQEASIVQAMTPALYPSTTNQPEDPRMNQNSEENLAHVEEIVQKYELVSTVFKVARSDFSVVTPSNFKYRSERTKISIQEVHIHTSARDIPKFRVRYILW